MKTTVGLVALLMLCLATGHARAANESVTIGLDASPSSGALFKEVWRPVKASLDIQVAVPEGQTQMTPLVNSRVDFPDDMRFDPDPDVTPVCPPEKVGPQASLGLGVSAIVALCPNSVIGTGTARIELFRQVGASLLDPQLVIFNAGKTSSGRPKITIYGYSKGAGAGLIMSGFLARNGELDVGVGVLPFDSAVSEFSLGIPGEPLPVAPGTGPGGRDSVVGQDPGYLVARCSTGGWIASGNFAFATRDDSSGELTSPIVEVASNVAELSCVGKVGKAKLEFSRIRQIDSVGSVRKFEAVIKNTGTATARNLKLQVKGGGRARAKVASLRPSALRKVKLFVRVRDSGKDRRRLVFRVSADGLRPVKSIRFGR